MQKIVVGYDGTDSAARAADEAIALARATGAELHFVTVVDEERFRHGMSTIEEHERRKDRAAAVTQRMLSSDDGGRAERLSGLTSSINVISGSAAERLVDFARTIEADLIVVGNRRVQGIERVLGSVAIAVLRHAPCSVYVAQTAH